MRNGLLILNVVLLIAVGVLFYLYFSSKNSPSTLVKNSKSPASATTATAADFKIAYFEMDSLESSFAMVKDVKAELQKKEAAVNNQLAQMEKTYRDRANSYQSQAAKMTQQQSEVATRDMMQLQQNMQSKKQQLDEEYQSFYMRKMRDVKNKIAEYLKEYNQDKNFTYIFSYEPGLFYFQDSSYNITKDVIKGLNESYKKKK